MKHFNYFPLYKEIRQKQKKELIEALQKYPNHEFHFGMDYCDGEQKKNAEYPYIIVYWGMTPVEVKVLVVKEKEGLLHISVRDNDDEYEKSITDIDVDIVLGQLENILDALPEKEG